MKINSLSSLTIHEILHRVKRRLKDPKILETEEPLQDLFKGALNILSSQTALPGLKCWEDLTACKISTNGLYWTGTLPFELKSKAWNTSSKILPEILPKMINCFAEKTSNHFSCLVSSFHRFIHFRFQKSPKCPKTISSSSEEVRLIFMNKRSSEVKKFLIGCRIQHPMERNVPSLL